MTHNLNRRTFAAASALIPFLGTNACVARNRTSNAPKGQLVWTELADMPFAVQEIYPTAFQIEGQQVIVNAGGLTPWDRASNEVTDAVSIYNPATNDWRLGTALPEPRHHIGLATIGGALYGVSGFARDDIGGWQMRTNLWRSFDVDQGPWEELRPLPVPQSEPVIVVMEGKIHVIGGRTPKGEANLEWNDQTDTDSHWVYDPENDEWEARAPLPMARNSAAGALLNGKILVVSGRTVANGNTPRVDAYSPKTDEWEEISPLPKPLNQSAPRGQGGLAVAVWENNLYAFGGEWFGAAAGVYQDVWSFNTKIAEWEHAGVMPRPRHGLGAVTLDDGIYLIGGALNAGGENTTAFLDRVSI